MSPENPKDRQCRRPILSLAGWNEPKKFNNGGLCKWAWTPVVPDDQVLCLGQFVGSLMLPTWRGRAAHRRPPGRPAAAMWLRQESCRTSVDLLKAACAASGEPGLASYGAAASHAAPGRLADGRWSSWCGCSSSRPPVGQRRVARAHDGQHFSEVQPQVPHLFIHLGAPYVAAKRLLFRSGFSGAVRSL
jgi:hypothetical protein